MKLFFQYKYIIFIIIFILLGLILYLLQLFGLKRNNIVKCNQKFGLCPAAKCVPTPYDNSKAYCFCDVVDGINYSFGNNSCEKISPYINKSNQEIIFSVFSPIIKKMGYHSVTCPSEAVNLNCMNKIWSVYPHDSSKAICICDKTNNKGMEWNTYNKDGESKTCNYQSGAIKPDSIKMHDYIKEHP